MKRRFEFRLQRVARVRELEERLARSERAAAEALARAAETRRDRARVVLQRSRAWLRELLLEKTDPRSVLLSQRALDSELRALERAVESSRTLRTQAEKLAAAHRTKKSAARALEELRTRALERHRSTLEQADNALLDETAQRGRAPAWKRERKRETDSRSTGQASDEGAPPPPGRSHP